MEFTVSISDREHARRLNEARVLSRFNPTHFTMQHREAARFIDFSDRHQHLFSGVPVFIGQSDLDEMARLITAIESLVRHPAWQARVLSGASPHAHPHPLLTTPGVFFGYDFHLTPEGPRLIEINTNAGGGLLNLEALSIVDQAAASRIEADFFEMFLDAWRASGKQGALRRVAIIDEAPHDQFLASEFMLFKAGFERRGIHALILDPAAVSYQNGALWHGELAIDLVYNRLTDFLLEAPAHQHLYDAWRENAVALTPHPYAYALYADKRNLVAMTDVAWLQSIGIDEETIIRLRTGIPETIQVTPAQKERLWESRKAWFFKPATGYGGKAAYRGGKLTRGVFEEIMAGNYIAQRFVPPSERRLTLPPDTEVSLKFDVRNFVYQGQVQLVSARLYQGQTTNFRTAGGGFSPVIRV